MLSKHLSSGFHATRLTHPPPDRELLGHDFLELPARLRGTVPLSGTCEIPCQRSWSGR
jgi:hypothetical protein